MDEKIKEFFSEPHYKITVLTGAGISAESGIPTFRGQEGYWTIGSKEYHPQEMATHAMFLKQPEETWKWYLYRLSVCMNAVPNDGHMTLVDMEKQLGERFTLITQNVDNLHLRAGNSIQRTFEIHGNVFFMRCSKPCNHKLYSLPVNLLPRDKNQPLSPQEKTHLTCPDCGTFTRPHVLWFDEFYDEVNYKFESSIKVADETDLLIIAGTSGATNLPDQIARIVFNNNKSIIDINLEENPFSMLAMNSPYGCFLNMSCSDGLKKLHAITN